MRNGPQEKNGRGVGAGGVRPQGGAVALSPALRTPESLFLSGRPPSYRGYTPYPYLYPVSSHVIMYILLCQEALCLLTLCQAVVF